MPSVKYRTRALAIAKLCAHLSAAKAGKMEPSVAEIQEWAKTQEIIVSNAVILRYAKAFGVKLKIRRARTKSHLPFNYDRPRVVALCLRNLMKELGVPVPPALSLVAMGRAIPDFNMGMTYPGGQLPEGETEEVEDSEVNENHQGA